MVTEKYCSKCKQFKPETEFYKNNRGGCKKCVRAYQKKYYEENYAVEKESDPEGFRTCSQCHELKLVSEFYRDRSNVSGYNHRCKKCSDGKRGIRRLKEKEASDALKKIIPEGHKKCHRCNTILPLSEFRMIKGGPRAGKPDSACQNCKRLSRQQNRERIRKQDRLYMQRPESKVKARANKKRWEEKNVAKQKAYRTEYRKREEVQERNKERGRIYNADYRTRPGVQEKARQRTIEWRKANPEKATHHSKIKYYKKKGAGGSHTNDQWEELLSKFDCCPKCKEVKPLTRDHIVPINRGGTNYISNIQPLCRKCNSSKQDHYIEDYRPEEVKVWADSEVAKIKQVI